jgi:aspartate/methionine/tyrosine aminotransferase
MQITQRLKSLPSEGLDTILSEVARRRAANQDVIPFHVGEPDFDTPANITLAAMDALESGATHYSPTQGLPRLREAVARIAGEQRGIAVTPDQVVVTPGSKMALHLLVQALCEPGDEVICLEPAYSAYAALAHLAGARVRVVPRRFEDNFQLDLDELQRMLNERTRIVFLNSPCNPTGDVMSESDLRGLARVLERWPAVSIVSDEIYGCLVYGVPSVSPASIGELRERTAIVDGVSKTYAMTGWRLGYTIVPSDLARGLVRLALHTFFSVNTFVQEAAVEALCGPQSGVDDMLGAYRRRREVMIDGINAIVGLRCRAPDGAFYAYVDTRALGVASLDLSMSLLKHTGVATYPGTAFGNSGEGFLRLSFATSEEVIRVGLQRMGDFVSKLSHKGAHV